MIADGGDDDVDEGNDASQDWEDDEEAAGEDEAEYVDDEIAAVELDILTQIKEVAWHGAKSTAEKGKKGNGKGSRIKRHYAEPIRLLTGSLKSWSSISTIAAKTPRRLESIPT